MKTFMKANAASLIASFCDYLFTIILKEFFKVEDIAAGISGTTAGGIINFFICRYWVFNTDNKAGIYHQSKRYFITWSGNLILNYLGLTLLVKYVGIDMYIAKIATSLTVAVAYNYPLQKKYVFKNNQY